MPKSKKIKEEEIKQIEEYTEDYGKELAYWEFAEHTKVERGKWWYISFIVIIIAMLIYSYYTNNPLFAIIITLFTIIYYITEKREPEESRIIILEDGIIIDDKFIEYKDLKDFYIIYHPPVIKNLYLEPKSVIKHRIAVPLENQNPVEIREILLKYIDEDLEKEEMPTSEGITRLLKL